MKKAASIYLAIVLVASGIIYFCLTSRNEPTEKSKSQTNSGVISSKSQWEEGTLVNAETTSEPGRIGIDNKELVHGAEIDITGATASVTGPLTGDPSSPIDVTCSGSVAWPPNDPEKVLGEGFWTVDLGKTVYGVVHSVTGSAMGFQPGELLEETSEDGNVWKGCNNNPSLCHAGDKTCQGDYIDTTVIAPNSFRYFRVYMNFIDPSDDPMVAISGFKVYEPSQATATHTSAAMQITNTNLYEWQTFTPVYTEPANTDIKFRLRTSIDGSAWTDWSAYQTPASQESLDISSIVTSATGSPGDETFYKYIQVETTFINTDGASTPTLDDYTIGYHTNVTPATPTPGSVTIGS